MENRFGVGLCGDGGGGRVGRDGGLGHNLTVIALALPVMLSVIVVSDSLHILRYWDNAIDMAEDEATISMILRDTFKATWLPCLTTSLTSAVGFGAL